MIAIEAASDPEILREVHRTLLTPSFRPGELLTEIDFLAQFPHEAEALLARDEEGRMLGAAVSEQGGSVVLLQYLAAAPAVRGRSIGSLLLRAVLDRWVADPAVNVVLAELDRPDAHAPHPLHGDPSARLRFYERFDALALELPYFQPSIAAGAEREHGMLLAAFDLDGSLRERGRLSSAQSAAVRDYLLQALQGARDPEAMRLLDAAEAPGGIGVRSLACYEQIPVSRRC